MFSFLEAAFHLSAQAELPNPHCYGTGVAIDSRLVEPGELFVALQGEAVDGHNYLEEAFRKGASGALISQAYYESNKERLLKNPGLYQNLISVEKTERGLIELAKWRIDQVNPVRIGITGSVGKTTTKDFLSYLLKKKYPVLATKGNFNNQIGLPLTLLGLQNSDRFCVAELGANKPHDIQELSEILKPQAAIITGISPAHLEGFGSVEQIYETKLDLARALESDSIVVAPLQDSLLCEKLRAMPVQLVTVGLTEEADYVLSDLEVKDNQVSFTINGTKKFSFSGQAKFLAMNAAFSIAIADKLGFSLEEQPGDWKDVELAPGRFSLRRLESQDLTFINDGYNASPESFEKAINAFDDLEISGKKLIVLADMLELGVSSEALHKALGESISKGSFDYVAAYGSDAKETVEAVQRYNSSIPAVYFEQSEDLLDVLKTRIKPGDAVLFKASRGMHIETVIKHLTKHFEHSEQAQS